MSTTRVELSLLRLTNGTLELKPVTVSLDISNGPRSISVVPFEYMVTDEASGSLAEDEEALVAVNALLRPEPVRDAREVVDRSELLACTTVARPVVNGSLGVTCGWL